MELKQSIATESGHWYAADGTTAYTVVGKNGKERNTTLRDARQLNLAPSVTMILRQAASPGLERWKLQNMLLASLTLPKHDGESLDDYAVRVIRDSEETAAQARDLGTAIHGAIERFLIDGDVDLTYSKHVSGALMKLDQHFGEQMWDAEKSFCHPLGFGGKCDAHTKSGNIVIDYKTKAFDESKLPDTYDEHAQQLAAYREGFGIPTARCAIVFVSTTVPGLTHIVDVSEEDLQKGWGMFQCLLQFWKIKTGYAPNARKD